MADLINGLHGQPNSTRLILYRNHYNDKGLLVGMDSIKELASEDAVEVVRCKDCKYGRYDIADRGMYCGRKNVTMDTYEDDFCSYGERNDG